MKHCYLDDSTYVVPFSLLPGSLVLQLLYWCLNHLSTGLCLPLTLFDAELGSKVVASVRLRAILHPALQTPGVDPLPRETHQVPRVAHTEVPPHTPLANHLSNTVWDRASKLPFQQLPTLVQD